MKRVVFPLPILALLLICTATGCPPGTGPTTKTPPPPPQGLDCDLAGKVPRVAMPPLRPWNGDPIPPPSTLPGRAFLFDSPKDPVNYWAVIVDGQQVTAFYELPASALRDFIAPTAGTPAAGGPVRASPTVKVGGPPRPMNVIALPPTPAQIENSTYWLVLACLQDAADAHAASATAADPQTPPSS